MSIEVDRCSNLVAVREANAVVDGIAQLTANLNTAVATMTTNLNTAIAGLREEMRGEMRNMREDMQNMQGSIEHRLDDL